MRMRHRESISEIHTGDEAKLEKAVLPHIPYDYKVEMRLVNKYDVETHLAKKWQIILNPPPFQDLKWLHALRKFAQTL